MSEHWINLGCGGNLLQPPWKNHDIDVDITRPLPWPDASTRFLLIEHCMEHVTPAEAWAFFGEARRILRPGGVLRIAVPSIERVFAFGDARYLEWLKQSGFGKPTRESAVENLICGHGHRALWSVPLLTCALKARGFATVTETKPGISRHRELMGIEGHGRQIGERNNMIETIVVEASR